MLLSAKDYAMMQATQSTSETLKKEVEPVVEEKVSHKSRYKIRASSMRVGSRRCHQDVRYRYQNTLTFSSSDEEDSNARGVRYKRERGGEAAPYFRQISRGLKMVINLAVYLYACRCIYLIALYGRGAI
jgi:hypothetical protein